MRAIVAWAREGDPRLRAAVGGLLCAALLSCIAACAALGRVADGRFRDWLSQAEAYCGPRYGAINFATSGERQEFVDGLYRSYYQPDYRIIFADRMGVRYPRGSAYIGCLMGRLPKPGVTG
jgi:hypothetical protein